jgi:hypothetical protein
MKSTIWQGVVQKKHCEFQGRVKDTILKCLAPNSLPDSELWDRYQETRAQVFLLNCGSRIAHFLLIQSQYGDAETVMLLQASNGVRSPGTKIKPYRIKACISEI